MKYKWLAIVLAFTLLTGCTSVKESGSASIGGIYSDMADILIRMESITISDSDITLNIQWSNSGEYDVLYGEGFGIQQFKNGQWEDLPTKENTAFNSIGYSLEPGQKQSRSYDLAWIYGMLLPGQYRFTTACHIEKGEKTEECELWAEFTLEEAGTAGTTEETGTAGTTEETDQLFPSFSDADFQKPPKLTLLVGSERVEAVPGTYTWNYSLGNGQWSGECADSVHPLQMKKFLKNHDTTCDTASLNFEVWPDEYVIRCWPDSLFGSGDVSEYDGKSEAVMVWNHDFTLKPHTDSGYIYEITATWHDDGSPYYGTATYVFYITSYPVEPISTEIMPR